MSAPSPRVLATTFLVEGQHFEDRTVNRGPLMGDRFLVTGANGCIGSWVVRQLVDAGDEVVALDLSEDDHRHRLVGGGEVPDIDWRYGDVTEAGAMSSAMADVDHVIHLAALQVPFCRERPALGSAVNLTGTVNVFEAALEHNLDRVVHASSIAVYGADDDYEVLPVPVDAIRRPRTLYGVYKKACEDLGPVYWEDRGMTSLALRPHTIYGPARDQGLTSQPTIAVSHGAQGRDYAVEYGGSLGFQFAPDVARAFIAATRIQIKGAHILNLPADTMTVDEFLGIARNITGHDGLTGGSNPLPLVSDVDATTWTDLMGTWDMTPVPDAICRTAEVLIA